MRLHNIELKNAFEDKSFTFTMVTANEAGMNENAMLTIIAAENASRSYK